MEIKDEILVSIDNIEILKLEHQHVNSLIQQHEAHFVKTIQWFFGIIMATIGALLSTITAFSLTLIDADKKYSIEGINLAEPLIVDSMKYACYFTLILFVAIILLTLKHGKYLNDYKNKIISVQNDKIKKHKGYARHDC